MKFLTTQFRRKMKVALIVLTRKHKSSGWTRQTLLGDARRDPANILEVMSKITDFCKLK